MSKQTRDGYTIDEAESLYHQVYEENYNPFNGNDSVAFKNPPDIETILGGNFCRWTMTGIEKRAKQDAKNSEHRRWNSR
jgi:hypothetical protein